MQEQVTVNIITEFLQNIISGKITEIIWEKTYYDVDIQINKLKIVNEGGKTNIRIKGNAEIASEDLKKIYGNYNWLKDIISAIINSQFDLLNKGMEKLIEKFINGKLMAKYGCKISLQIKDKKYKEKHGISHLYLDATVGIKTEVLEKFLENADLI